MASFIEKYKWYIIVVLMVYFLFIRKEGMAPIGWSMNPGKGEVVVATNRGGNGEKKFIAVNTHLTGPELK